MISDELMNPREAVAMNSGLDKENVQRTGYLAPSTAIATEEQSSAPRASIDSIKSLDVSNNIPRILSPMDAEDSPWGGM